MAKTKAELLEQARSLGINDVDDSTTNADLEQRIRDAEGSGSSSDGAGDDLVPSQEEGEKALGQDVGYIGQKVDPIPNEAYSQETDPTTSPSAVESRAALAEAEASGD